MEMLLKGRIQCECEKKPPLLYIVIYGSGRKTPSIRFGDFAVYTNERGQRLLFLTAPLPGIYSRLIHR